MCCCYIYYTNWFNCINLVLNETIEIDPKEEEAISKTMSKFEQKIKEKMKRKKGGTNKERERG